MAIPPSVVPDAIKMLASKKVSLGKDKIPKIIVEKPFGQDKDSAIKLNNLILKHFKEEQVYRIDHYLGKETVQNLLFFRFANDIFEPLWNKDYIDQVQIIVEEDIGIGSRGKMYEETGVVKDIVQNHIMQLISLVGMEPPKEFSVDFIRDEKAKLLDAIKLMDKSFVKNNVVFGQYDNYRKEKNVSPKSNVPTYMAAKFYIDNSRWSGVPFYVKAGKSLDRKITQIVVKFKKSSLKLFKNSCDNLESNSLIIGIQPCESISIDFNVKYPGPINAPYLVGMSFDYDKSFGLRLPKAYERLLIDCIKGDQTLFARQDEIELMWSIVDPIARFSSKKPYIYKSKSLGPKEAERILIRDGRKWCDS